MQNKIHLFSFIMLFAPSTVLAEEWYSLTDQKPLSISGIAAIDIASATWLSTIIKNQISLD